ncbi:MAG TPA: hypothetical protein VGS00_02345 [Thermoanaerobaculia bacterium]|nr:hypothetical protein [Thermoanaerobaculia bacterium]
MRGHQVGKPKVQSKSFDLPPDEVRRDRVNRRIVNRLVGDGSFFLAPTILKGRASLRVSITNFRTSESDLLFLLEECARIGKELLGS